MDTKPRLSRRNFLLAAGAGSVATAAAVAGKVVLRSQAPAAANVKDKQRGKGYEESAHVRNYYRTAKV